MALNKFERQLQLMLLLTQNKRFTIEEIAEKLDLSPRSTYRYLDFFKEYGFKVEKNKAGIYRLDKESAYFKEITELIHFTEDEAITLKKVLEGIPNKTTAIKHLLNKLSRLYDLNLMDNIASDEKFAKNQQILYQAVKEGRQCCFKNYISSNSYTTSDRLVEPFAFMAGNTEVRAFEVYTKQNKTYKIARIGEVVILPTNWDFFHFHKKAYTDAFHFTGEELIPAKLRLDTKAVNLLREEIIVHEGELTTDEEDHWIYSTQICDVRGIGRFIMGLSNHIQILENQELKDFVMEEMRKGLASLQSI